MKLLGYARVSTKDQDLANQIEEIKKYCEYKKHSLELFTEKASASKDREEFNKMMDKIEDYDGIVVTSLDRLGRSVQQLSTIHESFKKNKKTLIIINQNIDTSTKEGRLMFNMLSTIAEFERELIRERLAAGKLYSGKYGGRKVKELPREAIIKHFEIGASYEWLANTFQVSKSTIYRRLKEWKQIK